MKSIDDMTHLEPEKRTPPPGYLIRGPEQGDPADVPKPFAVMRFKRTGVYIWTFETYEGALDGAWERYNEEFGIGEPPSA